MTALADKLRATASRLIDKFGIVVNYTLADDTYDATTGDVTGTPTAKVVKISPPEDWIDEYRPGVETLAETSDLKTTLPYLGELIAGVFSALTFTPAKGHSLTWDGVAHEIVAVTTVAGDESPVAYVLRLKRGGA